MHCHAFRPRPDRKWNVVESWQLLHPIHICFGSGQMELVPCYPSKYPTHSPIPKSNVETSSLIIITTITKTLRLPTIYIFLKIKNKNKRRNPPWCWLFIKRHSPLHLCPLSSHPLEPSKTLSFPSSAERGTITGGAPTKRHLPEQQSSGEQWRPLTWPMDLFSVS